MKVKLFIVTSVLSVILAAGNYLQFKRSGKIKSELSCSTEKLSLAEDRALNCSYELSKKTLELSHKNEKIDSMRLALASQVVKSGTRKIKFIFK